MSFASIDQFGPGLTVTGVNVEVTMRTRKHHRTFSDAHRIE